MSDSALTWKDWADWYSNLFGLTTERDGAMIAAWVGEVFIPAGFSPGELHSAGQAIARGDPPRFREQHLARLTESVRAARAGSAGSARAPRDWTDCKDCEGTGLVSVPSYHGNPKPGQPVRMVGYEVWQSVICPCPAGKAFHQRTRPDWMTLEQYEAICPLWRDVVSEWCEERRAYARAQGLSRDADRTLGAIVGQLAGRSLKPGESS